MYEVRVYTLLLPYYELWVHCTLIYAYVQRVRVRTRMCAWESLETLLQVILSLSIRKSHSYLEADEENSLVQSFINSSYTHTNTVIQGSPNHKAQWALKWFSKSLTRLKPLDNPSLISHLYELIFTNSNWFLVLIILYAAHIILY